MTIGTKTPLVISFLEKEGDNILIGCVHWVNDPYEWTFECTREQLAHILDRWA